MPVFKTQRVIMTKVNEYAEQLTQVRMLNVTNCRASERLLVREVRLEKADSKRKFGMQGRVACAETRWRQSECWCQEQGGQATC